MYHCTSIRGGGEISPFEESLESYTITYLSIYLSTGPWTLEEADLEKESAESSADSCVNSKKISLHVKLLVTT